MRRARRHRAAALLPLLAAICVLALLAPGQAFAHATLERSVPGAGEQLDQAPEAVELHFSEGVESSFGALRVYDSDGVEVAPTEEFRPGESSDAIGLRLPPDLSDGSYTVTYRVISADSHPISGGFTFTIGEPSAGGGQAVADLLGDTEAGEVTKAAFWLIRLIGYAAIGLAIGAAWFAIGPWRRSREAENAEAGEGADAAFTGRIRKLLVASIAMGFLASLLALVVQGAVAAGSSFWDALSADVIEGVIDTRYGTALAIRAGIWLVLAGLTIAALSVAARTARGRLFGAGVAALITVACVGLALTPALAGHASTQSPVAVMLPMNVVHVLAMALWFGGIGALLYAVPAATATLEGGARTRLLSDVVHGFSPVALGCVIALAVSGTVQAIVVLGDFAALVDSGTGRVIVAKVILLAALIGLGAHNRRRLLPALAKVAAALELPGRVGTALRANLRWEFALIAAALAVTALMVAYPPPSQTATGPQSGTLALGPTQLEYTIDPAATGTNQVHMYLFDAEDGSQFTAAKELTADLSNPDEGIGPIALPLERSGPGHWVANAVLIPVPGDWELEAVLRTSRFDQYDAQAPIEVENG